MSSLARGQGGAVVRAAEVTARVSTAEPGAEAVAASSAVDIGSQRLWTQKVHLSQPGSICGVSSKVVWSQVTVTWSRGAFHPKTRGSNSSLEVLNLPSRLHLNNLSLRHCNVNTYLLFEHLTLKWIS